MPAERCQAVCFSNGQRTAMAHLVPKPDLSCVDMLTKMHSMANLTPHRLHLPDLAEHCFCQYQLALDGVAGRPMLARHFFRVCPKNDVFGYDFQLMHSEFLEAMKIQGCFCTNQFMVSWTHPNDGF